MQDNSYEDWFKELKSYSATSYIEEIIEECENLYLEYYEKGWSPAEAYEEEWG